MLEFRTNALSSKFSYQFKRKLAIASESTLDLAHVKRSTPYLAWILLSFLFIAFRLHYAPTVFTDEGIVLPGSDPYYRAYRIEKIVTEDLIYPLDDPNLSFPDGFRVPWPTGLDHLIALPLKILGVKDRASILGVAATSIPFLALATLWLIGAIATRFGGVWIGVAVGFALVVAPPHIHTSHIGRIDHHFLEAMLSVLGLFLILKSRDAFGRIHRVGFIALFVLGPLFWPQAWVISIFVAISFLIDNNVDRQDEIAKVFLISSAFSVVTLVGSDRFLSLYISPFGFSWWTSLAYFILGTVFFFLASIRLENRKHKIILYYLLPLLCLLSIAFFSHDAKESISTAWRSLLGLEGLLPLTREAQTPLTYSRQQWFDLGLLPLVGAWLWFCFKAFDKKLWFVIGYLVLPIAMALLQRRFLVLAWPLVLLTYALAIYEVLNLVIKRRPRWVTIATVFVVVGTALSSMPSYSWKRDAFRAPMYTSVRDASRFITAHMNKMSIARLDAAIASHWDFGHWFLHEADIPVVASPFQGGDAIKTIQLFTSTEEKDLEDFWVQAFHSFSLPLILRTKCFFIGSVRQGKIRMIIFRLNKKEMVSGSLDLGLKHSNSRFLNYFLEIKNPNSRNHFLDGSSSTQVHILHPETISFQH